MIQAAANGEGVALGRLSLLSRQIREGRLVAPFEKARGRGRGTVATRAYFVLTTPGAASRPEAKAFVDWLLTEARQEVAAKFPRAARDPLLQRGQEKISGPSAASSGRSRGP